MATQAQKEREVSAARKRVERLAKRIEKLEADLATAKPALATAQAQLAWAEQMPVEGAPPVVTENASAPELQDVTEAAQ